MQAFADKSLTLDKLYKGDRNSKNGREGIGWQLFLNGFFYLGQWKDNRADGYGSFFHNNGTIVEGQFEGSFFRKGDVKFYNGAKYTGTIDSINENFDKGTLFLKNKNKVEICCRNGKILRGRIELNAITRSKEYPDVMNFDFENVTKDPWFDKEGNVAVNGEFGLFIKFKGGFVYEGSVFEGKRSGFGYNYYSPNKYNEKDYLNGIFVGKGQLLDIDEYKQMKIIKRNEKTDILEKIYFSGFVVNRQSQLNYAISVRYLGNDLIRPNEQIAMDALLCSELILGAGTYEYLEDLVIFSIKFKDMKRLELFKMIANKRISFDLILQNIFKENPSVKSIVQELLLTTYSQYRHIFMIDCQPKTTKPELNILEPINEITNNEAILGSNHRSFEFDNMILHHKEQNQIQNVLQKPDELRVGLCGEVKKEHTSLANEYCEIARKNQIETEIIAIDSSNDFNEVEIASQINGTPQKPDTKNFQETHIEIQKTSLRDSKAFSPGKSIEKSRKINEDQIQSNAPMVYVTEFNMATKDKSSGLFDLNIVAPKRSLEIQCVSKLNLNETKKNSRLLSMETFPILDRQSTCHDMFSTDKNEKGSPNKPDELINENIIHFRGIIANGKFEGDCEVRQSDGSSFIGHFANGKRHGHGKLQHGNIVYAGEYIDDKPVGLFKKTEDGQERLGTFRDGKFISRVIKTIKGMAVEADDDGSDVLTGKAIVKIGDYDLECYFEKDELVQKQKNCLLKKRGADEIIEGKLEMVSTGKKGVFKTNGYHFYLIDIKNQDVCQFGD